MKYFLSLFLLLVLFASCTDEAAELAEDEIFVSAVIDSVEWKSDYTYTQKERGENGPLLIIGEGEDYTLELVLSGITEPGTYPMGISRNAKVQYESTSYSTLDVQDPGTITVTHFGDNEIAGTFSFDAQWLSSSNQLKVRNGKFRVFHY